MSILYRGPLVNSMFLQAPLARNQIGSLLSSATDLLRQQDQFQGLPSPTRDLVDEIVSSTQELAQSEQNSPAMREQVW